ncbi:hypothetical protein RDI58_008379 [Solanum bulbocastanum]|uniref:Uncharacterized protein n=1 Tax=Solanum bulbocastanum TaxID=147425 RepID=A0AAN8U0A8_SOLBU
MYGGCSTISTFPMLLSTTGEVGNTKNEASWFQIKKVLNAAGDYSYKLVFCPPSKHVCLDIGIEFVDAQPQLAIGTSLNSTSLRILTSELNRCKYICVSE